MATDQETPNAISSQDRERMRSQSVDFTSKYANNVEIGSNFFDFRFIFGMTAELRTEKDLARVEDHTKIIMSPQHAKLFLKIFESNLRKYEERFGWIPEPPTAEK